MIRSDGVRNFRGVLVGLPIGAAFWALAAIIWSLA